MKINRFIGSIFILIGTSIGAGMLALPITSAASGFYWSIFSLFLCWLFSYYTGLLSLEVNLWFDTESSYISMAKHTLGRTGQIIAWVSFLLLFYSLLAAYISGGGALFNEGIKTFFHKDVAPWTGSIPWMLIFGTIIFLGATFVDQVNRIFMIGLIAAFIAMVVMAMPKVQFNLLQGGEFKFLLSAFPVLMTSFGFHIVIPSLRHYLHGHVAFLKKVIFFGSLVTLLVYIIWECMVFGIVPLHGENGLISILRSGEAVTGLTRALISSLTNSWVGTATQFFAFFALASSFLGVAFGLFDLIADGLQINKNHRGRFLAALLTFIPPFIFALAYPQGFILALGFGGVFVAILHGIIPILMVVKGRIHRPEAVFRTKGGFIFLSLATFFFLTVIYADIASNLGWLPKVPG